MNLLENPFFMLGVTMRDDRRRIMDAAEEKSLISDEASVRAATAVLTNPRKRLAAEIGWLPGLDSKKIAEATKILEQEPIKIRDLHDLPSLARANLLADGLMRAAEELSQPDMVRWIIELAYAYDGVEAEKIITLLNAERSIANFPSIPDLQNINIELQERRTYYRQVIRDSIDKLPASLFVEIVTVVVDKTTENGNKHAPILIDDLVDNFEVEVQEFFEVETKTIEALSQNLLSAVKRGDNEERLGNIVTKYEKIVKNWDKFAQPIQVSARSRGTTHHLSLEIANKIRVLAVDLSNTYGLFNLSKRLTTLQQEVFAEVDKVVEQLAEDASTLDELIQKKEIFKKLAAWKASREAREKIFDTVTEIGGQIFGFVFLLSLIALVVECSA